ncbi:hypothetical protein Scep_003322 [Stephania cephalantha]|uniref:Uncharacterized protein n=1 Tax=Stephania cephalantha TaxID=152367 RepID=A0AAP0KQA1_9MAGN
MLKDPTSLANSSNVACLIPPSNCLMKLWYPCLAFEDLRLAKQWEDVRILRKSMRDDRMKKLPGYSWVDVANKTHVFGAENRSHPRQIEIYEKLQSLMDQIKQIGTTVDFTISWMVHVLVEIIGKASLSWLKS